MKDEQKCSFLVGLFKYKYPKMIWIKLDSEEALPLRFSCLRFILYTKKQTGLIKFLDSYYGSNSWKEMDEVLVLYLKMKYYTGHCSRDIRRVKGSFKKTLHLKRVMILKKKRRIDNEMALREYI